MTLNREISSADGRLHHRHELWLDPSKTPIASIDTGGASGTRTTLSEPVAHKAQVVLTVLVGLDDHRRDTAIKACD